MRYVKPLSLFQDLVRGNALERGRLLGLDVGDKYVGVAVSDIHNKIASPLSVLLRKKSTLDMMADDFQSLISELSLEGFIVGYPFDRQRRSPDAVQVKLFIDDLSATRKLEGLKYTYWDEGFTSKNVELLLRPLNLHPVTSKTIIDKFAAVGILQGYLDYVNRKQKSVTAQNFGDQPLMCGSFLCELNMNLCAPVCLTFFIFFFNFGGTNCGNTHALFEGTIYSPHAFIVSLPSFKPFS
ncbi:hypothetical protein PRUPE_5G098900 [Prunus persica]|uniref:YqgF/RNase H-like domain-containing protein n=1 Tax=Prunus persica TaxID=3760 RepID=A0A251P663_PRUPE|nr:hypothetical protein PRUPE_5G098900 [Prunus persica]